MFLTVEGCIEKGAHSVRDIINNQSVAEREATLDQLAIQTVDEITSHLKMRLLIFGILTVIARLHAPTGYFDVISSYKYCNI